ncbi:MAG: Ig-like domain-containing protein [Candidatus Krumholzibacteria bacterium]|nr:Ig-like domain-containing protein [Candidatus Krumholzibacteria bacterium]
MRIGRGAWWGAALALYALACAVSVPPPGGPEDRTPPRVTASSPAADSAGVSPESVIEITFSEGMTRERVERLLSFSPEVPVGRVTWDGPTLRLVPQVPLHPETTYVVTLQPGYRDGHNVAAKEGFTFAFATAAHIDSGRVEGTVFFRRAPTKKGMVRCFVLPRDSAFAPESARPDREVAASGEGDYALRYLPTRDTRLVVWAFEDKNGNGRFDRGQEPGAAYPDTIVLGAAGAAAGAVHVYIIDPDEPGRVSGRVANETGIDTALVSVGLYALGDTVPPAYHGLCDAEGRFAFGSVHAGVYGLVAFVDLEWDSLCATYACGPDSTARCPEPCVAAPDSIRVEPGAVVTVPALVLRGAREE